MTFGQKIKELRKERKMTLKEVAEKSGLSIVSVNFYENDRRLPNTPVIVQKLSVGLNCDFDELYELWKNS